MFLSEIRIYFFVIFCIWVFEFLKLYVGVNDFFFFYEMFCGFILSFQIIVGFLKFDFFVYVLEMFNWIIGKISDVLVLGYLQI